MKIQLGEITMNKTQKYLLPCLKAYGQEFEEMLNSVHKVASGIGDMMLVEAGVRYEQHIFILIDTSKHLQHLNKFLNWIQNQTMYEEHYDYDSVHTGNLLMLVIKLPQECWKSRQHFKHSQFSKMYSPDDINRYFATKPDVVKVLVKDHDYKFHYAKQLNEMYETSIQPEEIEGELDFPIQLQEELFGNRE